MQLPVKPQAIYAKDTSSAWLVDMGVKIPDHEDATIEIAVIRFPWLRIPQVHG